MAIRRLRPSDLAGRLLPGRSLGADSAYTRAQIPAGRVRTVPFDLVRSSVAASRHTAAFITGDTRNPAVAVLHQRRGRRSWEVSHLWPGRGPEAGTVALLEHAASFVASQRGERIFLRIRSGDPVRRTAQHCGLVPAYEEECLACSETLPKGVRSPNLALRPVRPADAYGVFRLYTATAPAAVRYVAAMTFDQWVDGQEASCGRSQEYVWDAGDKLLAWLRLARRGNSLSIDALLRPDVANEAPALLENAGWLAGNHTQAAWLVPSFCSSPTPLLRRQGWETLGTYEVLIRSVADRVPEPTFLPAQA